MTTIEIDTALWKEVEWMVSKRKKEATDYSY
jgi:hypothetical protein